MRYLGWESPRGDNGQRDRPMQYVLAERARYSIGVLPFPPVQPGAFCRCPSSATFLCTIRQKYVHTARTKRGGWRGRNFPWVSVPFFVLSPDSPSPDGIVAFVISRSVRPNRLLGIPKAVLPRGDWRVSVYPFPMRRSDTRHFLNNRRWSLQKVPHLGSQRQERCYRVKVCQIDLKPASVVMFRRQRLYRENLVPVKGKQLAFQSCV